MSKHNKLKSYLIFEQHHASHFTCAIRPMFTPVCMLVNGEPIARFTALDHERLRDSSYDNMIAFDRSEQVTIESQGTLAAIFLELWEQATTVKCDALSGELRAIVRQLKVGDVVSIVLEDEL